MTATYNRQQYARFVDLWTRERAAQQAAQRALDERRQRIYDATYPQVYVRLRAQRVAQWMAADEAHRQATAAARLATTREE